MMESQKYTCIEDLRARSKERVPKMFYDYVDSGSWTEQTYISNQSDLQQILLKQRVGRDISRVSSESQLLTGEKVSIPMCLGPTGLAGMQFANGEILAAQAAERQRIKFVLSTMSICSIEDVSSHTKNSFWFQLYVMKDRGFAKSLIERAKEAGCDALVLTLDLQLLGQRHKDIKNGLTAPPRLNLSNLIDFATKPTWCRDILSTKRRTFGNIVGHAPGVSNLDDLSSWTREQFDKSFTWEDIEWIKSCWEGKLILKGIMTSEDVRNSAAVGADALIVSNHGGRQLDGAPSTISQLKTLADCAQQCGIEVHFDGGIRSGQDVFRSLALGATTTYIGRAFLYGLGAAGASGVDRSIEIIKSELLSTMAFCGCTEIDQITSSSVISPFN